jgi:phosphoglycolate phosphatase-like HAD superfamily hydrolase
MTDKEAKSNACDWAYKNLPNGTPDKISEMIIGNTFFKPSASSSSSSSSCTNLEEKTYTTDNFTAYRFLDHDFTMLGCTGTPLTSLLLTLPENAQESDICQLIAHNFDPRVEPLLQTQTLDWTRGSSIGLMMLYDSTNLSQQLAETIKKLNYKCLFCIEVLSDHEDLITVNWYDLKGPQNAFWKAIKAHNTIIDISQDLPLDMVNNNRLNKNAYYSASQAVTLHCHKVEPCKPKVVVFDWDGTLIESSRGGPKKNNLDAQIKSFANSMEPTFVTLIRHCIDNGIHVVIGTRNEQDLNDAHPDNPRCSGRVFVRKVLDCFLKRRFDDVEITPDVKNYIENILIVAHDFHVQLHRTDKWTPHMIQLWQQGTKNGHLELFYEHFLQTMPDLRRQDILLVDDDKRNVLGAVVAGYNAYLCPDVSGTSVMKYI